MTDSKTYRIVEYLNISGLSRFKIQEKYYHLMYKPGFLTGSFKKIDKWRNLELDFSSLKAAKSRLEVLKKIDHFGERVVE